jgi:hypothetical protein
MWLDSAWDAIHTLIRPLGGAMLATAIIDPQDPVWQVTSLLLGGSAALLTHGAKAGARIAVNASPEPISNIVLSGGEDVATGSLLFLALANPVTAVVIAVVLTVAAVAAIMVLRRLLRRVLGSRDADGDHDMNIVRS